MKMHLTPAPLAGRVRMISSKSQAHRMLICAALAKGVSTLTCERLNDDIWATIDCLNAMGADITVQGGVITVRPIAKAPESAVMCCGESGSTLRFLLPVICALGIKAQIKMLGRLPERPITELTRELMSHGAVVKKEDDTLFTEGRLTGGSYSIEGNISSQYVSGLLFALCALGEPSTLTVTGEVQSRSYIEMTLRAIEAFGIKPQRTGDEFTFCGNESFTASSLTIEGDWSNAAFWLCAGAMGEGITVENMSMDSPQGDRAIVDILTRMGAQISFGENSVTAKKGSLKGTLIDASDVPDLIPVLSAFALLCEGKTTVINAERLRIKESDRLAAVYELLSAVGAGFTPTDDGIIIEGNKELNGAEVSSHNDHRMAMTAAVLSTVLNAPITINGAQCVKKSYPDFWEEFIRLGGKAEREDDE